MPGVAREAVDESVVTSFALDLFEEDGSAGDGENKAKVPRTIPIVPNKRHVKSRDGREFVIEDPQALIDAVRADGVDLVVGRQHDEIGSLFGVAGPAAGWIDHKTGLRRKGKYGIVATVEWTGIGTEYIESRSGRYISPVLDIPGMFEFLYFDGDVPKLEGIVAASVVSIPALKMPSINARRMAAGVPMDEETRVKLCNALGLPLDAKVETILSAAEAKADAMKAATEQAERLEALTEALGPMESQDQPAEVMASIDLTQWVPREEFNALAGRLENVEAQTQATRIDQAIAANKTRIASPKYEAVLREQLASGALSFDAFEDLMAATPESRLTKPDETVSTGAAADEVLGLEPYEREFCEQNKIAPKEFADRKARRIRQRNLRAV